jgi:hypothetical protein
MRGEGGIVPVSKEKIIRHTSLNLHPYSIFNVKKSFLYQTVINCSYSTLLIIPVNGKNLAAKSGLAPRSAAALR